MHVLIDSLVRRFPQVASETRGLPSVFYGKASIQSEDGTTNTIMVRCSDAVCAGFCAGFFVLWPTTYRPSEKYGRALTHLFQENEKSDSPAKALNSTNV